MKTLFNIWFSLAVAILFVSIMYLCTGCADTTVQPDNIEYEDAFCVAEGVGITLQEIEFINDEPFLYGKPAVLTDVAETLIERIFNNETDIWQFPIAAVCWYNDVYDEYVIDLD